MLLKVLLLSEILWIAWSLFLAFFREGATLNTPKVRRITSMLAVMSGIVIMYEVIVATYAAVTILSNLKISRAFTTNTVM
jgi:hypothetical protein